MTVAAIILAAGRGTRLKSTTQNKVSLMFHDKPIIAYAVDVVQDISDKTVVVVGAFADSVKDALKDHPDVTFAVQESQTGTGDALRVGFEALKKDDPLFVLVGYGDHMMFYTPDRIRELIGFHQKHDAAISLLTTHYAIANDLGRIVRSSDGSILKIVEYKDATEEEKALTEINPGFYCFNYTFLKNHLKDIVKSPATGEYYLTDLLRVAWDYDLPVVGLPVPFNEVGIGINRPDELQESQALFDTFRKA